MSAEHEKRVFEVVITGMPLKLKTSHDDETVSELVGYVDRKVSEALKHTKSGSLQNAAVLACLNIAEELILLKRRALGELNKFEDKTRKVISDLESSRDSVEGINH